MLMALAISTLLGTPLPPLGGDAGFSAHLRTLQEQYDAAPSGEAALRLAQGAARQGDRATIARWLKAARRHGVASSRAALVGGLAYLRAEAYESAIVSLYTACRAHPDNGAAHVGLWRSVVNAEVIPATVDLEAIRALLNDRGYFIAAQRPARPDGHAARAQTDLGMAALHQGRFDEATNHFEKALSVHRGYAEAYRGLGAAHARSKRKVKALAAHRLFLFLAGGDTRHVRRVRRQVNDAERHRGRTRPNPVR